MHLLDSDTLSHLHAGHPRVIANLRSVDDSDVGTTIVTKIEILRARFDFFLKASNGEQLLEAQHWLLESERLLESLMVIPFDVEAAEQFNSLRRVKKIKQIGRADLLIASISLANEATLVTRNLRHFRLVPNLRMINWVDA
jgi:tRNA(fMet)-specific endonuclease VapC